MDAVEVIKEKGATVYLMGSHEAAIALAKEKHGTVERRNLWAVVVKGAKHVA